MDIRHSRIEDIPALTGLCESARRIMRSDGNLDQWTGGYPSAEVLRNDIARGVSYIIEDRGIPVGTFAFIPGIEKTYLQIEGGKWTDNSLPYATIHRLASTEDSHGVAEACFNWCRRQVPNLRIDTHRDNRIMRHCIETAGFTYCGIIHLENGDERLAFQRIGSDSPVRPSLARYVEDNILPKYDCFDKGHMRDHAIYVISEGLRLAGYYDVNPEIVFAACACHDLGLREDRKTHHLVSGRIIREELPLSEWFSAGEIESIACAAEDHRASLDHDPRSLCGRIVAEADRQIIPETVIRRTVQYGLAHCASPACTDPCEEKEFHWQRTLAHLREKYGDGGYLKLWIPESPNAARLEKLRSIIRNEEELRVLFERIYSGEKEMYISRRLTRTTENDSTMSLPIEPYSKP